MVQRTKRIDLPLEYTGKLTSIFEVNSTWVSESLDIFVTHHSTPGTSSWDPGQTTRSSIDNKLMIPANIVTIGRILSLYVTGSFRFEKKITNKFNIVIILKFKTFEMSIF